MEGRPAPPAVPPRPPVEEELEEHPAERRLRAWILIVGLLALAAAVGAGYAISEIEDTKDQNREGRGAVERLERDLDVAREQQTERIDGLEGRLDDAASAQELRQVREDLDALDKRLKKLDQQDDGGESDAITTRVDDLEQRVEDLENDDGN